MEGGADCAANQCVVACGFGGLPVVGRDDQLWLFAIQDIGAEGVILGGAFVRFREAQDQGRARIVVPDFGRIDAMPVAGFARFEQEIDAGSSGACAVCAIRDPCLAVIAAFGVGLQGEALDELVSCGHGASLGEQRQKKSPACGVQAGLRDHRMG